MSARQPIIVAGASIILLILTSLMGCNTGLFDQPPSAAFTVTPPSGAIVGTRIALDASSSADPQSYALQYRWTLTGPASSTAALSATNAALVTFTPDVADAYTVVLQVIAESFSKKSAQTSKSITVSAQTQAASPSFDPPAGTYTGAQSVSISTATAGASIRYTTDDSAPTSTRGTLYSAPFSVTTSQTIKAIAYADGWADSPMTTATYTITGTVAAPVFSPTAGTYTSIQSVTISTTTAGAAIRYTTDGSTPTSTHGAVYSAPIGVPASRTIEAVAYKAGWTDSAVATATYTITGTVAAPAFFPAAGTYTSAQSVGISTPTSVAAIRYTTDGSTTTSTHGTLFSDPINVTTSQTIKAIAYADGWADSPVTTGTYTLQVPAPTFSPGAGTYLSAQSVTISTTTSGASIRYTIDGSTPTSTSGTLYSAPFDVATSQTIKAIAYADGWVDSAVATAAYTIACPVETPTFSPPAGTYADPQNVTISTTTVGAFIFYTIDGSTPTTMHGMLYGGPINVAINQTIKAFAYKTGWIDSAVATAVYAIGGVVSTLAGTAGVNGCADGTGSAARFYYPWDITTDGTALYVADTGNFTIRKIVISTRSVTTLAGAPHFAGRADGTCSVARFNYPCGITTDGTNLYVVDTETIREIR